jgi:hypothetical protein
MPNTEYPKYLPEDGVLFKLTSDALLNGIDQWRLRPPLVAPVVNQEPGADRRLAEDDHQRHGIEGPVGLDWTLLQMARHFTNTEVIRHWIFSRL